MTYAEKLKDPRWQKKRLEVFQRDNWKCCCCGYSGDTLNVHHRVYHKGLDPWKYKESLLVTLCEDCHKFEHELMAQSLKLLELSIISKGFLHSDFVDIAAEIVNMPIEKFSRIFGIKTRPTAEQK